MNSLECDTSSGSCVIGAYGPGLGRVTAEPSHLAIDNLAPGDRIEHQVTVTNGSNVDVVISYTSEQSGALVDGPAAAEVRYAWSTEGPLGEPAGGSLESESGCGPGPMIPAGTIAELDVVVSLPETAGNEYQGLEGAALLTFTASQCTAEVGMGPQLPDLPMTGVQLGGIALLALLVCVAGAKLLIHQQQRRRG